MQSIDKIGKDNEILKVRLPAAPFLHGGVPQKIKTKGGKASKSKQNSLHVPQIY
jgi:hypothetical protein